jgi:hypothetical protein
MLFKFLEKCPDQRGIDLLEAQARRRLMQVLLRERQKLTEGISIGTDGVRAGLALLHQALGKEPLQQRRQGGGSTHD